jgi:putative serine protease PepD
MTDVNARAGRSGASWGRDSAEATMRAAIVGATLAWCGAAMAGAEGCDLTPAEVFRDVAPSVVEVHAVGLNPFRVSGRVQPRSGTGFLIEGGYVATNFHVVVDGQVITAAIDGVQTGAKVVGVDPALDLAVLEPFDPLPDDPVTFAEADTPPIGAPAYALGYPLGLGLSISAGIVSGAARVLNASTSSWLVPFLQTDAAISAGNSGGPIVDGCGHVIGMATRGIFVEGAENLGFAIPAGILAPALDELVETGKISRPWHGLYGQMVTPQILWMLDVPDSAWEETIGFLVETVEPGSGADRAGLYGGYWPVLWGGTEIILGGDIITHVDGVRIDSLDAALAAVEALEVGERVVLEYLRDGERRKTSVRLEERPLLEAEINSYRALP